MAKTIELSPQGAIGSFVVEGVTVKSKGKLVIMTSPTAQIAVIDVLARQSSDPQDHIIVDAFIAQLTKAGYAIKYTNGVRQYFDPKKRWDEFLTSGDTAGLSLSDAEKDAVASVRGIFKKFEAAYTLPKEPYPFATDEQAGVDTKLAITGNARPNVRKVGSGHFTSVPIAKRVFLKVATVWKNMDPTKTTGRVSTLTSESFNGYYRGVEVYPDRIEIGCQTIGRRSLENFAVEQGWAFPQAD
jgi:hypothetical protein